MKTTHDLSSRPRRSREPGSRALPTGCRIKPGMTSIWALFIFNLRNQCNLWTKKTQNEPNFKTRKITISPSILRTKNYEPRTGVAKNKPNSNPISALASLASLASLAFKNLRNLWTKMAKNGAVWDKFGVVLDNFGVIWDKFGVIKDTFGNTNTPKNRIKDIKNAENIKKAPATQLRGLNIL